MTVQTVTPFIMRNAIVQLGTDDFAAAVSSAVLQPSSGTVPFKGLKPSAVFSYPQAVTYELALEYAQDWHDADSLSWYLWNHQGETVPATLNPDDNATGTTSWALQVSIVPGSVGGPVDSVAVTTVTLGVVGQPVPTLVPDVLADDVAEDAPAPSAA